MTKCCHVQPNNVKTEVGKEGMFPVVTIEESIYGEYLWVHKDMKSVAPLLNR